MASVAIIMSTYNGEKYIREQISSLLEQDFCDFKIFVRDDGSTDGTVDILKEMAASDDRIFLVEDVAGQANKNLGFGESFGSTARIALQEASIQYFAFCDQDDYWEKGKISSAVSLISDYEISHHGVPVMCACNYQICDSNLNPISTFCDDDPMAGVSFENMFFEGVFSGFAITINRPLAEKAFAGDSKNIYYHDKWVSLIALGLGGKILYDTTFQAKYRRHEAAASSASLSGFAKLKWRVDKVLNGDFCPRTSAMLKEYKSRFYNSSDADIQNFLDVFTGNKKARKIFFKKRLRRSVSGEILMRLILITGKL